MTIQELFKWLTKPVEPVRNEVHTIEQAFARTFGAAAAEARHVETEASTLIHTAEKELEMIPQAIQSLIDEIKNALAAHGNQSAADAAKIADLNGQLTALHAQCDGHEATIATLTQQLADANAQIADTEAALAAVVHAAPSQPPVVTSPAVVQPADGSASADVTP